MRVGRPIIDLYDIGKLVKLINTSNNSLIKVFNYDWTDDVGTCLTEALETKPHDVESFSLLFVEDGFTMMKVHHVESWGNHIQLYLKDPHIVLPTMYGFLKLVNDEYIISLPRNFEAELNSSRPSTYLIFHKIFSNLESRQDLLNPNKLKTALIALSKEIDSWS